MTEAAAFNRELGLKINRDIWNGRQFDRIPEYFAEDFVSDYSPGFVRHGRHHIQEAVERSHAAFEGFREEIKTIVADDERVVIHFTIKGRHTGQWGPLPPTGKEVAFDEVVIMTVRDGKVAHQAGVIDNVAGLRQVGALPVPPTPAGLDRPPAGRPGPGPSAYTLTVEDAPRSADVEALAAGLNAHAIPHTQVPGFRPVAVFLRNDAGVLVGGVWGYVNWNWLFVGLVWLSEPLRGGGHGARLMAAMEAAGRARGCRHVHLDTFSWQARPLYERLGYEVFATLDDYPPGHQRFFMRKRLA